MSSLIQDKWSFAKYNWEALASSPASGNNGREWHRLQHKYGGRGLRKKLSLWNKPVQFNAYLWAHLYFVDGVVIALMHCDIFEIYCAPPNLGITRTWKCRLNFAQRPIFQAWGSLTSLKSQTTRDPQLKVPPRGLVLRMFTSWKNPSTSARFEPANLGSRGESVTPRPPRPTSGC